MKKLLLLGILSLTINSVFGQEENKKKEPSDTTRFKLGTAQIIIVDGEDNIENDTIDAMPSDSVLNEIEAHWAGIDFGFTTLLNSQNTTNFGNHSYWNNDPAKSFNINWNILEHKFPIYKNHIGVTTGLGFGFYQVSFKNNYVLQSNADSVFAIIDTINDYSKNKFKAAYLQAPLLIEICNKNHEGGFYLDAGILAGVRLASKVKREGKQISDGKEFEFKSKGLYNLNAFKLDGIVRIGYDDLGVFATYSLIPLFDKTKTDAIYPVTFGLSYTF